MKTLVDLPAQVIRPVAPAVAALAWLSRPRTFTVALAVQAAIALQLERADSDADVLDAPVAPQQNRRHERDRREPDRHESRQPDHRPDTGQGRELGD